MIRRQDRKKQITQQRQEQILDAALQVFSRLGFDRATIPEIASEAGVAVGTIYNYYESKRDLLVAIAKKNVIDPFTAIAQQLQSVDDPSLVTALMKNRLDFGLENMSRFLPLLMEVQRDEELRRMYSERVLLPVMNMMEKFVASRMKEGAFRDVEPAIVTRASGGMVIGFLLLYLIEGEQSPVRNIDRKKLAAELAGFILKGLQK